MKLKFIFFIILFILSTVSIFCYQWPTVDKYITSDFGPRLIDGSWDFHEGIDIRAPVGTEVYAVEGWISHIDGGAYNILRITQDNGMESRYLHLSSFMVAEGARVNAGQKIALSGETGSQGQPHFHFDFGQTGPHPLKYLPYDNTTEPVITILEPITYENGGIIIVKAATGIKARVDTTEDKDLNEVKFFVDGEEKFSVSYDPKINCNDTTVNPIGLGDDEFIWSNLDTAGLSEGTHNVEVRAGDAAGGVGSKSISIFVNKRTDDYLAAKGIRWLLPFESGLEKSGEVDYPNPEWGQEWTGSVISAGPAKGDSGNGGEMLLLEVLSRGLVVTPETKLKFNLLDCRGGVSAQTLGGFMGNTYSDDMNGRLLGVNIIAYDSNNNILAKAAEKIYEYHKGETLVKYIWNSTWQNYDIIVENNADFTPQEGVIKSEIKPWSLI